MASNKENPVRSAEEEALDIAPLIASFTEAGFNSNIFTPAAFIDCGINHHQFVKLAKCFSHLDDLHLKYRIIEVAIRAKTMDLPYCTTLRNVIRFLKWLSSFEGQQAVTAEQQRSNKAIVPNTHLDIDLISALNYQMTALIDQNKRTRMEFEPKIRELQRRMEVLTVEKDNKLAAVAKAMVPGGRWKEPDLLDYDSKGCSEIMEKVDLYCIEKDRTGFQMSVEKFGFEFAMKRFSDRVYQAYQIEFLASDCSRQELRDWMKCRIVSFLEEGDLKQADTFSNLLVSIGGVAVVKGQEVLLNQSN